MRTFLPLWAMLAAAPVHAATVVINDGGGRLILQIGSTGGGVDQVNFAVPGANVGDGTPIVSSGVVPASPSCPANTVLIDAQARSQSNNPRTATLTVDSSVPLSSGGFTIPFSQFVWTATAPGGGPNACLDAPATIPSGVFSGAAGQPLISFNTSQRACICAEFSYLNQSVVSAGTYTGRVTYTLAMP